MVHNCLVSAVRHAKADDWWLEHPTLLCLAFGRPPKALTVEQVRRLLWAVAAELPDVDQTARGPRPQHRRFPYF
jgi:hypothetical protein